MDQKFDELKAMCEAYKAAPPANPVGAMDWTLLLAIIPALLGIFIKDANLLAIIMKVVEILTGLFTSNAATTTGSQP